MVNSTHTLKRWLCILLFVATAFLVCIFWYVCDSDVFFRIWLYVSILIICDTLCRCLAPLSSSCLVSLSLCVSFSPAFYSPPPLVSPGTDEVWGLGGVCAALLAAVLAVESRHKTEICTGSGQSHDQIKSSQVSSREPIHSHHKKGLCLCFRSVSLLPAVRLVLGTEISPPVHKSPPSSLTPLSSFNAASLVISLSVSWHIMWDLSPEILLWNLLCAFLFWGGIYSPPVKSYTHWGVLHPESW